MRSKIAFSLCAVAFAALLPATPAAAPASGAVNLATPCCTPQQRALCVRFHEIGICENGTCVCDVP